MSVDFVALGNERERLSRLASALESAARSFGKAVHVHTTHDDLEERLSAIRGTVNIIEQVLKLIKETTP